MSTKIDRRILMEKAKLFAKIAREKKENIKKKLSMIPEEKPINKNQGKSQKKQGSKSKKKQGSKSKKKQGSKSKKKQGSKNRKIIKTRKKSKSPEKINENYYETERNEKEEEDEFYKNKLIEETIDEKIKKSGNIFQMMAMPSRNETKNSEEIELFTDPCRVLNKLKEKIGSKHWNIEDIRKLDLEIPMLKEKYPGKTKKVYLETRPIYIQNNTKLYYGEDLITIKDVIGRGSNGEIRKAIVTYNYLGKKGEQTNKKIAIKFCSLDTKEGKEEFLMESMIQNEIWCDQRMNPSIIGSKRVKLVPKIEFLGKIKAKYFDADTDKFKEKIQYVIGMENLDGDLHEFFNEGGNSHANRILLSINDLIGNENLKTPKKKLKHDTIKLMESIIEVSEIIKLMQDKYRFMHRDFHGANIMYKKTKDKYEWYIIDFGMSTATVNSDFFINKIRSDGSYYDSWWTHTKELIDKKIINKSHDLRLLISSLIPKLLFISHSQRNKIIAWATTGTVENELKEIKNAVIKYMKLTNYLFSILKQTGYYIDIDELDKSVLFWNYYEQVQEIDDLNFHPENVIKNIKAIMDGKLPELILLKPEDRINEIPLNFKNFGINI